MKLISLNLMLIGVLREMASMLNAPIPNLQVDEIIVIMVGNVWL